MKDVYKRQVIKWGNFQSYWSQTGTYDSIQPLINKDFDGLKSAIVEMISGAEMCIRDSHRVWKQK